MAEPTFRLVGGPDEDPDGFAAAYPLFVAWTAAFEPDDPAPSPREVAADWFDPSPEVVTRCVVASVDEQPVGMSFSIGASKPTDELQVSDADVFVLPAYRNAGLGTELSRRLLTALAEAGQTSVLAWPCVDLGPEPALALCQRLGLTQKGVERCSRVDVAGIDPDLLDTWLGDAATTAAGYRLEQWTGVCPDHVAEAWSRARAAMEDEPHGLDYNPWVRAADEQRIADQRLLDNGYQLYRTLCLSPDGDAAGLSEIRIHLDRPSLGHQHDTAVVAAHRGHRIGRWLKAANLRFTLADQPTLAVIQTYNNEANPWMLAINVDMGFTPFRQYLAHQGPVPPLGST
jgi:GNAT superfamily N-acetyltransferase